MKICDEISSISPQTQVKRVIHGTEVWGMELNQQSGCVHYHSPLDIIALKFKCCHRFFACRFCHDALADHPTERFSCHECQEQVILCGSCGTKLQIATYLTCNAQCPQCQASFNPKCKEHLDLYFIPARGGI